MAQLAQRRAGDRPDRREPRAVQRAGRLVQEARRRRARERRPVGAEHRVARRVAQRLGDRAVQRERRRPRRRARAARRAATSRASSARATSARRRPAVRQRLDQRLADGALGHDVGARCRARAAPRAVPGPIAAIAGAGERAGVAHAPRSSRSTPLGRGEAEQVVGRRGRAPSPASGSMRIAGASTTLGAERAQPRGQPAGLGARARHRDACARAAGAPLEPGELVAQRGDGADDRDRGRAHACVGRAPAMSRASRRTTRWSGSVPRSTIAAGSSASRPSAIELLGDARQLAHAHVEARACPGTRPAPASRSRLGLARVLVAGDERDRAGDVALRHGDARVGGRRDAGGHAGHDLELDAGRAQRLGLLAAAAEDERVAALQPHDPRPARACSTSSAVVSSCGTCSPPPTLPTSISSASGARAGERLRRDQAVVEDHVGARRSARARARSAGRDRRGRRRRGRRPGHRRQHLVGARARQQPRGDLARRAPRARRRAQLVAHPGAAVRQRRRRRSAAARRPSARA